MVSQKSSDIVLEIVVNSCLTVKEMRMVKVFFFSIIKSVPYFDNYNFSFGQPKLH